CVRALKQNHEGEKRLLPAAGLPDNRNDFARRDGQIEPVDRDNRLPSGRLPEHFAPPGDADGWGSVHARHRSRGVSTRATMSSSRKNSATSTMVQAKTSATENSSCATDN